MSLQKVKEIIETHKDRKAFMRAVGRYYPPDSKEASLIKKAYKIAKDEFREVQRDSGERYFEHLRAVTLIVMVYLRIKEVNMIIAALLHDITEDIDGWDYCKVKDTFGVEVAEWVWYLTKPNVAEFDNNKQARNRRYHENFLHAPRKAMIIKLADRLHNLITLWETGEEKRKRKIQETQDFYLPLAEREIVLVYEIEEALAELQLR